jgi:uncharacterized protein (DUF433 family)
MIVGQICSGRSIDNLLADYPSLEHDEILDELR